MRATQIARLLHIDPVLRNHDPGLREFLIGRCMRSMGAIRTNYLWQRTVTACGRALGWVRPGNFLVLSAARSGTTLLVDYLNCHRQIRCRSEILNRDYEWYGNPRRKDRRRLQLHVEAQFVKRPGFLAGAKILTYQLDELAIDLAGVVEVLHQPAVIVLYREQVIEQFASLKMADQSRLWHSTRRVNNGSIRLDLDEFAAFAQREHRMWRENLAALEGLRVHYLAYERLAELPEESLRDVFAFLDLQACPIRSKLVRLNSRPLKDRLVNYDEFARAGLLERTRLSLPFPRKSTAGQAA